MDTLTYLAPYFEKYITINRVAAGQTYDYAARGFYNRPVVDVTMHLEKCRPGSWLYVAVAAGADLGTLAANERFYVGSQTLDRMFRGDGLNGTNFHHREMRAGNGDRNLETYLRSGGKVDIHRASADRLAYAVASVPELSGLEPLLRQSRKHPGYWFEQTILNDGSHKWSWNTQGVEGSARRVLASL